MCLFLLKIKTMISVYNFSFQKSLYIHLFYFSFLTSLDSLSVGTIVKRTLHNNFSGLFFGLPFTKPNPDFVTSVKSKFQPDSKLLVVCQEGLRLVYDFLPNLIANSCWTFCMAITEALFVISSLDYLQKGNNIKVQTNST